MHNAVPAFVVLALLASTDSRCDTPYAPALIEFLEVSGVKYKLVVAPTDGAKRFWGDCKRLTVQGTFLEGPHPQQLNVEAHLKALNYLRSAFAEGRAVNLGWMSGLDHAVETSRPCSWRSRALMLVEDEHATVVLSYLSASLPL